MMQAACLRKAVRGLFAAVLCCGALAGQASDVPYVPTPMNVVDAMLELGKVGPGDFLIDLGSGDGRISIRAASRFGTRGFGVDLDDKLVRMALDGARRQGVQDKVTFEARNIFATDISRATVVTAYLLNSVNLRLRPELFAQLKPGTRIVSHDFDFGNWEPDHRLVIDVPDKAYGPPRSDIMLWVVPADFSGKWTWRMPVDGAGHEYEVSLEQTFQKAKGLGRIAGQAAAAGNMEIHGDTISFVMGADIAGKATWREFRGRISGDMITGSTVTIVDADVVHRTGQPVAWQAQRIQPGKMNISGMNINSDAALRIANSRFTWEQ